MTIAGLTLDNFLSVLKVDPQVMLTKASTVNTQIGNMKKAFEELEASVNNTKNYWIGDAGDAHRAYYTNRKAEIEEIFARLQEHVTDLQQMSAAYSGAEQESEATAEELPSDVIV